MAEYLADKELDELLAYVTEAPEAKRAFDEGSQVHEPTIDPFYRQSFSWNIFHEQAAYKIQAAYKNHRLKLAKLNDALAEDIKLCEEDTCKKPLVFLQKRFCDNSCARRFAVSKRWANEDKENIHTPRVKKRKVVKTSTNEKRLGKKAKMQREVLQLQQENDVLKQNILWYQQVLQQHVNI